MIIFSILLAYTVLGVYVAAIVGDGEPSCDFPALALFATVLFWPFVVLYGALSVFFSLLGRAAQALGYKQAPDDVCFW